MSIGSITGTPYANSSSPVQRTQGISANGQTFSDEQIKQFVQANQDNPQALALQASSMGLNADQIQQALSIGGINVGVNDINNIAAQYGYDFNSKDHSLAVAPQNSTSTDRGTNVWSPMQSRWIAPSEVKAFIDTNPSDRQIFEQASKLGLTLQDLNTALKAQGYTGQALGQHYNGLAFNLFSGGLGYSALDSGHGVHDGRIVAGGGHRDPGGSQPYIEGQPGAAFGSSGLVGQDYNGTTNWSVKDAYIGSGTGIAGDGFAGSEKTTVQTARDVTSQYTSNSTAVNSTTFINAVMGDLLSAKA